MKFVMIVYFVLVGTFSKFCNDKIIEIDKEVYNMYVNSFKEYLSDEDYRLVIDKEKVREHFENKGYQLVFFDDYKFKVIFKFLFNIEREYYFYMVINNEK